MIRGITSNVGLSNAFAASQRVVPGAPGVRAIGSALRVLEASPEAFVSGTESAGSFASVGLESVAPVELAEAGIAAEGSVFSAAALSGGPFIAAAVVLVAAIAGVSYLIYEKSQGEGPWRSVEDHVPIPEVTDPGGLYYSPLPRSPPGQFRYPSYFFNHPLAQDFDRARPLKVNYHFPHLAC